MMEIPVVSFAVRLFVEFMRSTPLLIQLFAVYYFLPLYGVILSAVVIGVPVLGLHYSAYCAEVSRAGLEAVPRG